VKRKEVLAQVGRCLQVAKEMGEKMRWRGGASEVGGMGCLMIMALGGRRLRGVGENDYFVNTENGKGAGNLPGQGSLEFGRLSAGQVKSCQYGWATVEWRILSTWTS
jgi:hypothetical protein